MGSEAMFPEMRVATAVLLLAVRDAQGTDPVLAGEARRWLAGRGADVAEALGVHPDRLAVWIDELPALACEQLPLFER